MKITLQICSLESWHVKKHLDVYICYNYKYINAKRAWYNLSNMNPVLLKVSAVFSAHSGYKGLLDLVLSCCYVSHIDVKPNKTANWEIEHCFIKTFLDKDRDSGGHQPSSPLNASTNRFYDTSQRKHCKSNRDYKKLCSRRCEIIFEESVPLCFLSGF